LERDAQQLAEHARKISHDIHPAALEHLGLMAALRANGTEVRRITNVEVLLETDGKLPALSRETSLGLFRIVQEAVWNAARHSGADAVKVTVRADPASVELTVADHGRGFDSSQTSCADSLGLVSMRERARLIRAELDVDSSLGGGTTVRIVVRPGEAR
jgi:signal transduction histidine kinase